MDEVVIVGAARTPIGTFNGMFAGVPAWQLGAAAVRAALERARVEPGQVEEVILGNVLPAGQAMLAADLPVTTPAMTVNKVCGSGLKAVALGAQAIRLGDASVVVAGG